MGLNPSHGIECVIFSAAFQGFYCTLSLGETATLRKVKSLTRHFSSSIITSSHRQDFAKHRRSSFFKGSTFPRNGIKARIFRATFKAYVHRFLKNTASSRPTAFSSSRLAAGFAALFFAKA